MNYNTLCARIALSGIFLKFIIYDYDDYVNINQKKCVYFIICNNCCAYVGQSRNVSSRIATHKRHLLFDKVIVGILNDNVDINWAEDYWISKTLPTLNGSFVTYEKQHYGGALDYKIVKEICDEIWENPNNNGICTGKYRTDDYK